MGEAKRSAEGGRSQPQSPGPSSLCLVLTPLLPTLEASTVGSQVPGREPRASPATPGLRGGSFLVTLSLDPCGQNHTGPEWSSGQSGHPVGVVIW